MTEPEKKLTEEEQKLENEKAVDSALATMIVRLEAYIVPLINELFGESFPDNAKIRILNRKHIRSRMEGSFRRGNTDVIIEVAEALRDEALRLYHFTCEPWFDKTAIVRCVEHGCVIAEENAKITPEEITITIPNSGIIFLRPDDRILKKYTVISESPQRSEISYGIPTLQMKDYSIDRLFERKLLILIPFYFFRYMNEFEKIDSDEELLGKMENEVMDINTRLEAMKAKNELTAVQKQVVQELLLRVTDSLTAEYRNVRKIVDTIMSGYIARTKADEILEEGYSQGISQGERSGRR